MERVSKNQVKFVRSLQLKKYRDEYGMFVAEGCKCVSELAGAFDLELLIAEEDCVEGLTFAGAEKCLLASRTEIEQMSSLRTPQGVIGVFRYQRPTVSSQLSVVSSQQGGLVLALDGVQDPGNMGTIIRTADWFGVRHIVCSHDTADCFNPKVVQATMGALARVRVEYVDLIECLSSLAGKVPVYGTLLDGRNMYEKGAIAGDGTENAIIVMGNEGNGISTAVRRLVSHPLLIPSYPAGVKTSESLNVATATAIVLAEFRRLTSNSVAV